MNCFFVHTPYSKLSRAIEVLPALGVGPEIYISSQDFDRGVDEKELKVYARRMRDAGLQCTIHAPFVDLSPAGTDAKVVAITRERFQRIFAAAEIFHPLVMVFHTGYDRWKFALNMPFWLENSRKFWLPFVDLAAEVDTFIAMENIFETSPIGLKMLIDAIGSPRFGTCFDIGHWSLFSQVDLGEWLALLRNNIFSLHLHDNRGYFDDHLVPGDGLIDFVALKMLLIDLSIKPLAYTFEPHDIRDLERGVTWLRAQYG